MARTLNPANSAGLALLLVSASGCAQSTGADPSVPWPTTTWPVSSPEAQGMSSGDLADALEFARQNEVNIHSLTIVRNGFIVLDAYFYPFPSTARHDLASATKSVVSVLVGLATADGHLGGVDQAVISALPADLVRGLDGEAAEMRVGDLLSMQSGFDCGFGRGEPELAAMRSSVNWTEYALRLPVIARPGTRYGYCSPNFHLLSAAITSATGKSALDFAEERLFDPLGIDDVYWPSDVAGVNHGWGDMQLHPRDMAKLGLLMLRQGRWQDRRLVPESWIESSISARVSVNDNEEYGLGWWLSRGDPFLFEANGRGGQRITIVPELDLVVVMTGGGFEPGDIGQFILRAMRSDSSLPEDPAGQRRLADALERIAQAPPQMIVQDTATADRISGRTYELEENGLGIDRFSIDFSAPETAQLRLRLDNGEELLQPLGLDGRYRLTDIQDGAASAGRGEWQDDGRFRIEFNRLSLINRYIFDIRFGDTDIEIEAFEPTELGRAVLQGSWVR